MLTVLGKEGLRAWELEGPWSLSSNFNAVGNLSTPQKYLLFTSEQCGQRTPQTRHFTFTVKQIIRMVFTTKGVNRHEASGPSKRFLRCEE